MRLPTAVLLAACGAIYGCAGKPPPTAGDYCAMVGANIGRLNSPAIADPASVDATTELYQSITAIAPLAVKSEWETMTATVEAAGAADPNDPAAVQKVADMARAAQHSAATIADYTAKVCGVTIAAPTTTLAVVSPPSTTAP